MCAALGEQRPRAGRTGDISETKLGFGRFFEGKKVAKGSALLLVVTLCSSISPTTG